MERDHELENEAELTRLQALLNRLNETTLSQPMPDGWTVASVLAHVAFWDARAIYWLDQWDRGAAIKAPDFETREDIEWINNAAKPLCLAMAPRDAANLALRLAEETDRRVAAMSDELLEAVQAVGCPFNLSRAEHRREHLDDIERVLERIGS